MTSEYENGPQLFDTEPQQAPTAEPAKNGRRKVVKKSADSSTPNPVKTMKTESAQGETTSEADAPKKPVKRRGRPPKTEKNSEETAAPEVSAPKSEAAPEPAPKSPMTSEPVSQSPPAPQPQPTNQNNQGGQNNSQYRTSRAKNGRQKNNNYQKNRKGNRNPQDNRSPQESSNVEVFIADPAVPSITVNDLSVLTLPELRKKSRDFGFQPEQILDLKKQELIVEILKAHTAAGGVIMSFGTLEILPDGYGFLRSPHNNYLSGAEDVYVSISQIKNLSLKTGDTVRCQIRPPKDAERYFAMIRIETINYDPPEAARIRASFDSLTPLYPDSRLNLETEDPDISTRVINLFAPIGKGQRSLIVAPPRAGKTILMQKIANAITTNHPEVYLMVLLIDERPEEVTDMRRTVKGEVIASTFDEQASRHVTVAEMVIEKAKRLVEHKRDVVILLDNITRLARAYNQTVPASGKILSGGVDSNALHKPKRFLGAARNIEHGGSLTIIANALIETGSRMDEVIFEEFKGTGNNEIVLDRRMAERRLYPAINIKKSGTRREDLLLAQDESVKIWALRNAINPMEDIEMTEFLVDKMKKTKNNEAFLRSMNTSMV